MPSAVLETATFTIGKGSDGIYTSVLSGVTGGTTVTLPLSGGAATVSIVAAGLGDDTLTITVNGAGTTVFFNKTYSYETAN